MSLFILSEAPLLSPPTILIKNWIQQVKADSVRTVESPSGKTEDIINQRRSRQKEGTAAVNYKISSQNDYIDYHMLIKSQHLYD